MQDFANKKILLGLCGGIAAYKSAYLVRELTRLGAQVRVVMTQAAQQFITPLTLQALSGNEVRADLFDPQAERAMGHIELARWADHLVIAPATANCLAKMAQGIADDLLTTIYLVSENPVIVCPAMNRSMWAHPATQQNCQSLIARGVMMVGPAQGLQACGEEGYGRMSEVDDIIAALRLQPIYNKLQGKQILITAGPTQEAIDPVRVITNRSSGKMGYALAQAAAIAGAEVTLISGPTAIAKPAGVTVYEVKSAAQMYDQVMAELKLSMIFIGCAAVADFAVANPSREKIKKNDNLALSFDLTPNPDIIAAVAASGKADYVVGFAAETQNLIHHAQQKLTNKKLDMVIANHVGESKGFDQDYNQVTIITQQSQQELACAHKTRLAGEILAMVAREVSRK